MFIKIIKKTILILIALSMLVISIVMWRYQGDTYKLRVEKFETKTANYQDDIYRVRWAMSIGTDTIETNKIEMEEIHLYDIPFKVINFHTYKRHPSESIIYNIIQYERWKKSIPNSETKTYKISKGIWISKNISIKDAINYNLKEFNYGNGYKGIESASLGYFGKSVNQLNIYEIIMLEAIAHAPSYFNPQRHPKRLLQRINSSIVKLKKIFPKKYISVQRLDKLPKFNGH